MSIFCTTRRAMTIETISEEDLNFGIVRNYLLTNAISSAVTATGGGAQSGVSIGMGTLHRGRLPRNQQR